MTGKTSALALLLLGVAACEPASIEIAVPFQAGFGQHPLTCGPASASGTLTDLRFYVSEIQLFDADDNATDVQLIADDRWQGPTVALLDLEDGSGSCENGTSDRNSTLRGRVPAGDYRGIRFVIGVPFDLNHADPLSAAPPLDDTAMHWHWRSGYKFLRAGFRDDLRNHWLHVGSAGCQGTLQSITACRFPNRVTARFDDYVPGETLIVDLEKLYDAFAALPDPKSSCSSGPAEESCRSAFALLGLDAANGMQSGPQRLIRVAR